MPNINYISDDKTVDVTAGTTILNASLRSNIAHAHACGGHARCSTCRVLVYEGLTNCAPRTPAEQKLANRLHFSPPIRLACQTQVLGDVSLRRLVLDAEDIELTSQIRASTLSGAVGQEKKLAILFSDIRGFTTFSEKQLPYDVVHVLNRYFYDVGQAIANNGGYIDNYMGDGVMVLFGVDDPDNAALRAVKAGLEMLKCVEDLNPYMRQVYNNPLAIGIGIHYGEAVVGLIGATNKKKETAIGDAVNLASRIESATKQVGASLLISEDTYNEVKDFVAIGKTDTVSLKGKSGDYMLYEVVGLKHDVMLKPIEASHDRNDGKSTTMVPAQTFWIRGAALVIGSAFLTAFLMGFPNQLPTGNFLAVFALAGLGFVGASAFFWALIR